MSARRGEALDAEQSAKYAMEALVVMMSRGAQAAAELFADGLSSSREGYTWACGYAAVLGELVPGEGVLVAEVERLPGARAKGWLSENALTALAALTAAVHNGDGEGSLRVWLQLEDEPESQAALVFTLAEIVAETLIQRREGNES